MKNLVLKTIFLFVCMGVLNSSSFAQKNTFLPVSTPEAEGVSTAGIDSFLTAVNHSNHEFHSIMVLRHGKAIAKGWWYPYDPTLKHSLYSLSKSFTSTAVGFAISEKKLAITDKVLSFFPEDKPDTISPYLASLTVRDLITMTAGQEPDPTTRIPFTTENWVKAFLATPIVHKPGTQFLYNTMATFMLSAIVQKVTGQKEIDYLKPRLFGPLGITGEDWEYNKQGINTGGWGLRLKTEDLAKMGQLYLQKGIWNGVQVLPVGWVDTATTFKIDQAPGVAQSKKDSSDWMQGYCYQFWRCRHNAFRGDGAFGQYIIVMPDQDAVIAITSETADMQGELNLVWKYLLPAMQPNALPENHRADEMLKSHLASLILPPLTNKLSTVHYNCDRKKFNFKSNPLDIKSISFLPNFTSSGNTNSDFLVGLKKGPETYYLWFLKGKWLTDTTPMTGPSLLNGAKEEISFLSPAIVSKSYRWLDANTLELKIRFIESPHSEIITCHFDANKLTATVEYSFNYGKNKVILDGTLTDINSK